MNKVVICLNFFFNNSRLDFKHATVIHCIFIANIWRNYQILLAYLPYIPDIHTIIALIAPSGNMWLIRLPFCTIIVYSIITSKHVKLISYLCACVWGFKHIWPNRGLFATFYSTDTVCPTCQIDKYDCQ